MDTNSVLAVAFNTSQSDKTCNYCRRPGHVIPECRKLQYKNSKGSGPQLKNRIPNCHPHTTGAIIDDSSLTFSLGDIKSILKQLVETSAACISTSQTATDNATVSITPDISSPRFFDSGCYNHMTSESIVFTSNINPIHIAVVHTTNNSKLNVNHIGDILAASSSLSDAYLVPKLPLNLISVGQLCELGYEVYFLERGCIV